MPAPWSVWRPRRRRGEGSTPEHSHDVKVHWCTTPTFTMLGLALSTGALLIGISLFVLSFNDWKAKQSANGARADTGVVDLNASLAYWHTLQTELAPPLLLPDSPPYRALAWMTKEDPLRDQLASATNAATASAAIALQRRQRYALATIYFANAARQAWNLLAGMGWMDDNGDASTDNPTDRYSECTWIGVLCNDRGEVIELNLGKEAHPVFDLYGTIPTELGLLTQVTALNLAGHRLQGTLPSQLFGLTKLRNFTVSENLLTRVSTELGQLTDLVELDLQNNILRGTFPSEIATLSKLRHLNIYNSQDLTGNAWQYLSSWPDLEWIDTSFTKLTGSVPTEIGKLTKLRALRAGSSDFSGSLPTEMGLLTDLVDIFLGVPSSSTGLTGTLPTELGLLTAMQFAAISHNQVTGTLPTQLGRWTNIIDMSLYEMRNLGGTIPTEFGLLTNCLILRLGFTSLSGTVPSELAQLSKLEDLQLRQTDLTGELPSEVCEMPRLIDFTADCVRGEAAEALAAQNKTVGLTNCNCCTCFT